MDGLWLQDQQLAFRADLPIPKPQPGEALIRVRLAGICGTDLEMVKGYYPYSGILGHEFVGQVEQVNAASEEAQHWLGRRVAGEINVICGRCPICLAGRPTHCEQRTVLGIINRPGVFAEYVTLPLANLHFIPDAVPDDAAVFTEPLAAALEILEQVVIRPTDRVLLVGAGRLGQLIAQVLALTGCDLQVAARHPQQRALLAERGIRVVELEDIPARRMDVVVEATGSPAGFELARQAIRPRGTLVLKSTYHGDIQVDFSALVVDEITLVGSRCGPFEPALRLMASGQVTPQALIAQTRPLSDGLEAFAQAAQSSMLKVLLQPGGESAD